MQEQTLTSITRDLDRILTEMFKPPVASRSNPLSLADDEGGMTANVATVTADFEAVQIAAGIVVEQLASSTVAQILRQFNVDCLAALDEEHYADFIDACYTTLSTGSNMQQRSA